jgi:hypothetical protein
MNRNRYNHRRRGARQYTDREYRAIRRSLRKEFALKIHNEIDAYALVQEPG